MTDIVSTALDVEHGTEKTFVAQAALDLVNLLSVSRAVQYENDIVVCRECWCSLS